MATPLSMSEMYKMLSVTPGEKRSPPAVVAQQRPAPRRLPSSLTNTRGQRRPARQSDPFPQHEVSVDVGASRGSLCISPSSTSSSPHEASRLSGEGSSTNTPACFDSSASSASSSPEKAGGASPSHPAMPRMAMSRRHDPNSPAAQFGRLAHAIYPSPAKRVLMPPAELSPAAGDEENVPPAAQHSNRPPPSPHSKGALSTPQKQRSTPQKGSGAAPYPHNGARTPGKKHAPSPHKGSPSPHKKYIRMGQTSPDRGTRQYEWRASGGDQCEWDEEQMRKAVEDVEAFAKYLGMDVEEDRAYFWIAVEAMIAPLPPNWAEYYDKDQPYYHNESTDHTQWEHPLDEYHRQLFIKTKAKDQEKSSKQRRKGSAQTEKSGSGTTASRNYSAQSAQLGWSHPDHPSEQDTQSSSRTTSGTCANRPKSGKPAQPAHSSSAAKAAKKSVTEKLSKKIFSDTGGKPSGPAASGDGGEADERNGKKGKWWKRTFLPLRDKTNHKVHV